MGQVRRFSRKLRWVLPGGVVVIIGAVLAGTVLASAAAPSLPRRTPAQLLVGLRHATLPRAMSGVISESASLGFPALPDIGGMSSGALSAASFLSGTHTIQFWYAGPRQLRIALPVSFGETDLRVNGTQVWLWDSHGQTATRYIVPASHGPARRLKPGEIPGEMPGSADPFAGLTPMQAANRLLAMVGPTTKVSVAGTVEIAGRPAYQLAIAPRTDQSLIGKILIAIDAQTRLPLDVQVFARGSSSPAFRIGFTSLTFAQPAMSNFTFTPPPGAHVKTAKPPASLPGFMPGAGGPPGLPGAGRPGPAKTPAGTHDHGPLAGARTIGSGWLTVAISGPAGHRSALPGLLLRATTRVHGSWGSGRLLRTSLLSVLITSKGQVLIGAVTPAVLYADAAKVK